MKRFALVALWLVATAVTTVIAYVAVRVADAEVTNRPLSMVLANATTPAPGQNTRSSGTTIQLTTSTDTSGGISSTTTDLATSTTGPTSSSPTTTAQAATWQQTTVAASGGLVVLSYRPGEVRLAAVVPHPGFSYEVKDQGPPEVRVEFEASDVKIEIRAEWDGGLVTEVDEDG